MTPEAASVAAQSDHHRDCLLASADDDTCVQCHRAAAMPFHIGSRVCEHCLFGLAMAPFDLKPAVVEADAPIQTTPGRALGPYVLAEEIGRGGMGVIYRAVHRETNEVVAVKTVLPEHEGCEETLARFRREAEAIQSLDHPHSMPIFEVGHSDEGVPFFSMKLALGGSLHHLTAKYRGRWRQTAELMVKVSQAVHHAHLRGILHRDIKPGNILFTEYHEPLVTDFGLAKSLTGSSDLTRSCAVLGTPSYVAPEQAAGKTRELTVAADVYSLGAVLYELLTGQPPFVGDNPLQVLEQVSKKSPVHPRRLVPAVPKPLELICLRCLERDPKDRYASAQELIDDLERWLDGRQLAARPAYFYLRGFVARHPAISAWCGCISVLFVSLWFAWRIAGHHPITLEPPTRVAVVIDDLEQLASSRLMVRQLWNELRRGFTGSMEFSLQGESGDGPSRETTVLDPLAYGRAVKAQMILSFFVRRSGNETHLAAEFLRCDNGNVVWQQTYTFSEDQINAGLPSATEAVVRNILKNWNAPPEKAVQINHSSALPDAQSFFTRAMELTKHGNRRDMEAAIALLRRSSEIDPQFVDAHAMLAYALWVMACYFNETDQYAVAMRVARETLVLNPACGQAHRVIASCLMSEARYDEALEEFGRAMELSPRSAGSCLSHGLCLRRMGHPKTAIAWLERAVRLEPAHATFHSVLAETLILCGLDQQAEAAMQRAVELEQDTPDSQFAMVALRIWQKRFDEARRLCAQARDRFPDYGFGLDFAAWAEFVGGDPAKARPYFEALRTGKSYQKHWIFHGAINPTSALAYIAQQTGSPLQARTLEQEALRIDFELLAAYPRNCRILHDLAATYAIIGDEPKAFDYLKQSLAAGWTEHCSTQIDPRFSAISSLPRFMKLLDETRPQYSEDAL